MSPRLPNVIPRSFIVNPHPFIVIPRPFFVIPAKAGITGNVMNAAISRRSLQVIARTAIILNRGNKRSTT